MIVSHKHKFIFFRTRKTAGTSFELALAEHCGPEDIICELSKEEEAFRKDLGFPGPQNHLMPFKTYNSRDWARYIGAGFRKKIFDHLPAKTAREYISTDVWDKYYKFAFERNPFDKAISYYYWITKRSDFKGFEQFIREGEANISDFHIYSINGISIVDEIFRYEEMEKSLDILTEKLALSKPLKMPEKRIKGGVRKSAKSYQELINPEIRKLIEISAAREIKLMNYKF